MTRALAHRGPDGEGVEVQGPAALGHRRLAVNDLTDAARQPLSNEDGTVWVTFNGEIYGFAALRKRLERKGHRFRSNTDSEVIVHLYEDHGADLVDHLRGMFAFALWDTKRNRLLLVRDRAGQKPLHYRVDPQALRFASEPGGLLADPTAPRPEADPVAIHHYLHYGYVPSPLSAFAGFKKLPPAHVLDWRPGGPALLRRYWHPSFGPKLDGSTRRARASLREELEARLEESVRLRLVADVPVGGFLSGGIDSGLVVSSMSRLRFDPIKTFTIGFEDPSYDERLLARAVAKHCSTDHAERVVPADATSLLPLLVRRYGEPFADSSAIPTYRLAELAREQVTVALTGDAGDELFAGYLRHSANELARFYGALPRGLRGAIADLALALPHRASPRNPLRYARRFLSSVDRPLEDRNAEWSLAVKPNTARLLYDPDFAREVSEVDPFDVYRRHYDSARATCDDERVLWADFALYQPDDILVKVDVATMCHGLEARAPFLDHTLVEWVMSLPFALKSRWGRRKRILRRLAEDRLPPRVARAPKRGFAVPLDAWFRGPLLPLFRELVLAPDARVQRFVSQRVVEGLLRQHLQRRWNWHTELWSILWLELWFREVLEPAQARSELLLQG
jgi:asparagine synthase (glutamine-hydrolysing)